VSRNERSDRPGRAASRDDPSRPGLGSRL
jgi:hypothetical protein